MVVIYTQDQTYVFNTSEEAKDLIISLYGEKVGKQAYQTIKNSRPGSVFRKYGGPLIKVVNATTANSIIEKEIKIGMI